MSESQLRSLLWIALTDDKVKDLTTREVGEITNKIVEIAKKDQML